MRYRWEIKTSDAWYAGTDASVFLSLAGLDASMREVQISDPDAINDWEKGDINHGTIETDDLGELQTGTLRHDQSGAGSGWSVDWVKVTNEEDAREWTATVGKFDEGGRFPMLRFSRTNDGNYAQVQAQKARKAQQEKDKAAQEKADREKTEAEKEQAQLDASLDRELAEAQKALDRELAKAKQEALLAKKRAEIEKLKQQANGGASNTGVVPPPAGTFRTYELYGVYNGGTVPLSQVVRKDAYGRFQVVPGGRVMVGDAPTDGFGLAGIPGRWQTWYAGRSPAEFGLDADKAVLGSDGSRGFVLDAGFLSQVFGSGWRGAVYA